MDVESESSVDVDPPESVDDIAPIDERIEEITRENADHEAAIYGAQSKLEKLSSAMSIEEARELLAKVICLNLVLVNWIIEFVCKHAIFLYLDWWEKCCNAEEDQRYW